MYRLRPKQNGLRIFYTLGSSYRIGETDPPASGFRINLHNVAGNRRGHVPLLGRHVEVDAGAQDLVADLFFGLNLFKDQRRGIKHFQLKRAARSKDMPLWTVRHRGRRATDR
jgi:hypothetical protein